MTHEAYYCFGGNQISAELVHVKISYRQERHSHVTLRSTRAGLGPLSETCKEKSPARLLVDLANDRRLTRGL